MGRIETLAVLAVLVPLLASSLRAAAKADDPPAGRSPAAGEGPAAKGDAARRTPVILDTDIGDDIDDTWALAMLLGSPELNLKLVTTEWGNAIARAKIIAKFLQQVGRTDVAVGVGLDPVDKKCNQSEWTKGYDLKSYPGKVHQDGVQAIVDTTIMKSPAPVTVISIGPTATLAAALAREPRIATKARFVGMHGSVRRGYGGGRNVDAEYNVKQDVKACQRVFTAPWDMTITPLDTCGVVHLGGDKYAAVRDSKSPLAVALMENYKLWCAANNQKGHEERDSTTLFDTVAVYLALADDLLVMETLGIRVTDDGFTRIDPQAKVMRVATEWKDLGAFENLLVKRLTSPPTAPAAAR